MHQSSELSVESIEYGFSKILAAYRLRSGVRFSDTSVWSFPRRPLWLCIWPIARVSQRDLDGSAVPPQSASYCGAPPERMVLSQLSTCRPTESASRDLVEACPCAAYGNDKLESL